jgi:hypothetical protein
MIHWLIDFIGLVGIALLGYGLWLIAPVWMFCILGAMLIGFSLFSESGTVTIHNRYKKEG